MRHYDIAVIGAGSGGLTAALTAHRRGAQVALIEKNKIGGECTHSGCIPSKTLISSARLYHAMKHAEIHGLPVSHPEKDFEFAQVMSHVDDVVQRVYLEEQPAYFENLGIDVYINSSGARFISSQEIQIGDEIIRASNTIIVTGSSPRMAPHEGGESIKALNNENFWSLRELPPSIVFLGGGVISAELGQSLARFGCEVTIIDKNPYILKVVDEEVRNLAITVLTREGISILSNSEVKNCVQQEGGKVRLILNQNGSTTELLANQVFVSLGRTPNTAGLSLESAGVDYSDRGILTNEYLQTAVPNIYACGDVTSPAKFTHVASYQANICVENIMGGNHLVSDLSGVPWAIFMEPEIGHVGLSEAQAQQNFGTIHTFKVGTDSHDRFKTEGNTEGFLKLIMDENDVILGADAIGAYAGEWIQFFTLAINQKLPLNSLNDMIFIYPTFAGIVRKVVSRYMRAKTAQVHSAPRSNV